MRKEFFLFKENSDVIIIVNENSNNNLLQRCQDHWAHTKDFKYLTNKSIFSKKNLLNIIAPPKYLFIHIPKTGGTSFKFNIIYNPKLNKKIAIYHKIHFPPSNSRLLDVFKEKRKMFTLLRDPTDTVISAYFHFKHLAKMKNFAFFEMLSNMQTKFLLGYDIFSDYKIKTKEFDNLLKLIEDKKLIVGIQRSKSMNEIYNLLELRNDDVDNYILNKKKEIGYQEKDVSKSMREYIKKRNTYDQRLYKHVLNS